MWRLGHIRPDAGSVLLLFIIITWERRPYVAARTHPSGCWQRLLRRSLSALRRCRAQKREPPPAVITLVA